jgi:heptosyltransferase-2
MRIPGRWFPDEYARLALDEPERGPRGRVGTLADLRGRVPDARAALPELDGRRYVVVVPGGARNVLRDTPQRRWSVEKYAAAARELARDDLAIVLLGDERDRAALPAFAGVPSTVDALGRLSLPQALGVLSGADVVVCHDTGPLHLAGLVRAPTVALFGPTVPSELVQVEDERIIALWGGAHLACRPCYDGREVAPCANNLCMQDIAVESVVRAARDLRARTAAREATA